MNVSSSANRIYYYTMNNQSGEFSGLVLILDSLSNVRQVENFESDGPHLKVIDLKDLSVGNFKFDLWVLNREYYMNYAYVADGGNEVLVTCKGDSVLNGIIYTGCETSNLAVEYNVEDKNYLELLSLLRKKMQSKK